MNSTHSIQSSERSSLEFFPSDISLPSAVPSIETHKRKIEFLSKIQARLRFNMNRNIVHKISQNDINTFINHLIKKLNPQKYFLEIAELEDIKKEFYAHVNFIKIPTKLLQLATVHENNPMIQILLPLSLEEAEQLKSIPTPPILSHFFEELDFYIILNKMNLLTDRVEKINYSINYAKKFIRSNKEKKAIKLLNLAKTMIENGLLSLHTKKTAYNTIASLFFKMGYKNEGIKIWLDSARFINNFDMFPPLQLETFQEIAQYFIQAEAHDEIVEIILMILQKPCFWDRQASSLHPEEVIAAIKKIFQQVIEKADLSSVLCIIQKVKLYPHMDSVLEKLCETLLQSSTSPSDLMTLAQCIRCESAKQRIFKKIYHKFLSDRGKAPLNHNN